ncbi:MAG: GlxA family transcriptional regulator [Boseongicola sp.]
MRILIVLVPGFSHLSLGAVLEPLHTLARLTPEADIRIELGSIDEPAVVSSAGVAIVCELSLPDCLKTLRGAGRPEALFLCCGLRTPYKSQSDIQKLLRTAHRAGVPILGTGCAAWKMADAGILHGGVGTVHWTTLPAFAERHRDIVARDALFVTSDDATSTPGEAAALDMVIGFIEQRFPEELVHRVCNHLMISYPRPGDTSQPTDRDEKLRGAPPKLRRMATMMSNNLESPILVRDIAQSAGISLRQAERLFSKHLGLPPKGYYLKLRLQHGRMLIEQSSMSILEISIAVGFSSRRVFTQYYREEFGFPPAHTRRTP